MSQLAFEPRDRCICGEAIDGGRREIERKSAWGTVRFVQCAACGSWCQAPQVSRASLASWFDSPEYRGSPGRPGVAYADYLSDEPARQRDAEARYRHDLKTLVPPGSRVLEIGCATGSLLASLKRRGCDVTGVDLSPTFAGQARERYRLDVVVGDVRDVTLAQGTFDAVLLFGTIGNLPDLESHLTRIRSLLRPSGILMFNFPDAASPLVRLVYGRRFWMFTPSVSCFMTRQGCTHVLARAGLSVVSMRRDWQSPSLSKLVSHAGLRRTLPFVRALGLDRRSLPFALPMPAVVLVTAAAANGPTRGA